MPATTSGGLRIHLANIGRLMIKELRSIRADPLMLALVVYSFTVAVFVVATDASTEARNLAVGVVDEDRSILSRHLRDALLPPIFQPAVEIPASAIDDEMDHERLVFVVEIPPRFESDLLAGRSAAVQVNVDATVMAQAGIGASYLQTIIQQEVVNVLGRHEVQSQSPINIVIKTRFNPNLTTSWFSSVMQVINSITMLTLILSGAALLREREQGTIEHLLVMPLVPIEIMLSKVLANGLVIMVAAGLSLVVVVQWWLHVPVAGSLTLFLTGAAIYALAVAALGILLGTLATTMGQLGLLAIPVLVVMNLLSGSSTPMESMPLWLQYVMRTISPTPHFVAFAQAVLYRGAGIFIVWRELLVILVIGAVYFAFSLGRFRRAIFES
jgi:ABC-2 type transport system permease protein